MSSPPLRCAALAVVALGCGASTTIRHPAHAGGVVDPNEVVARGWQQENELGLPKRTLDDTASLIELNDARICFYVSRWDIGGIDRLGFSHGMLSIHGDAPDTRRPPLSVTLGRTFRETRSGTRQERRPRRCIRHTRRGRCESYAGARTVQVPVDYRVEQLEATVCFANDGLVTPDTQRVVLEVHRIDTQRFEWVLRR